MMAQWNVEGADPKTGAERVIQVSAETKESAERAARKQGLLVSAVYKSTVQTSADALDDMVANASSRPTPPPAMPSPSLSYRTPAIAPTAIPQYQGLVIGGFVLRIFAYLYYSLAILGVILAVLTFFGPSRSQTQVDFTSTAGTAGVLFATLATGMVGGILHALSAACGALRDIARNSFR
jgi:hypothetical protein